MFKQLCLASFALVVVMIVDPASATAQDNANKTSQDRPPVKFAIAIHGGAGSMAASLTDSQKAAYEKSLTAALRQGRDMLNDGTAALDVVEQVIRTLEDDPLFNAGRGAVFNAAGSHELDASIMDGRDRSCGAVAGVRTVKNPVSLARLVMTKTPHVLLAADGAEQFAEEMEVERVETTYFDTDRQRQRWQAARQAIDSRRQESPPTTANQKDEKMGTVGCVVLDRHGNLAAGTSTGGLTNKRYGRIGDSPIIGAGTFADNATCAVSCTGIGEHFIRNAVAYDVSARMEYKGEPVADAVAHILHQKLQPGYGGIIAVSRSGEIALDFNTPAMFRAAADSNGRFEVGIGRE